MDCPGGRKSDSTYAFSARGGVVRLCPSEAHIPARDASGFYCSDISTRQDSLSHHSMHRDTVSAGDSQWRTAPYPCGKKHLTGHRVSAFPCRREEKTSMDRMIGHRGLADHQVYPGDDGGKFLEGGGGGDLPGSGGRVARGRRCLRTPVVAGNRAGAGSSAAGRSPGSS